MTDRDCVEFLLWALPRLNLRWTGFSNLRGQVCKRIRRRLAELGLADTTAYRARLEAEPAEWAVLDAMCIVTISRFYRDQAVWDLLKAEILPALATAAIAKGQNELCCWSSGCASGEEPYTLSILWTLALADRYSGLRLRVLATDADERVLARAHMGAYAAATLRELPPAWRELAFQQEGELFRLRERFREAVELREEDVRRTLPERECHLILCRNVVCTYFDEALQRQTLERMLSRLSDGGAFVIGRRERLPSGTALTPWYPALGIYRHSPTRFSAAFMNPPRT